MSLKGHAGDDPEIAAIAKVHSALKDLEADAQNRVLKYVASKLRLPRHPDDAATSPQLSDSAGANEPEDEGEAAADDSSVDDLDGMSPVAKKWMRRNELSSRDLSTIFSLGIDEIDLVARKVPGKSKRERMMNVFLLKGIASYLGTGAARFTHEQVKEACLHYDAYDVDNFSSYLKSFSADVSGSKERGYVLSARGITDATDLIKRVIGGSAKPSRS